jgi:hypothetical protein
MHEDIAMRNYENHPTSLMNNGQRPGPHGDFLTDLGAAVRDNPLPAALIGMGVVWMLTGGGRTSVGEALAAGSRKSLAGAERAGEAVIHGAREMGSMAGEAAHRAADRLTDAAGDIGRAMSPSDEETNDRPGYVSSSASALKTGMQDRISQLLEQRPLVLGALGVALGAGIAASLPVSNAERKVMGKASEHLQNKVSHVAEQAKDVASAAVAEAQSRG